MPKVVQDLIKQYVEEVRKIYGVHVRQIILYGSYARGDFRPDSDVDIMILVDIDTSFQIWRLILIWIMIWISNLLQKAKHFLTNGLWTIYFIPIFIKKELFCMEQHNHEIGTRRDLVLYRLETARNDLRSSRVLSENKEFLLKLQEKH